MTLFVLKLWIFLSFDDMQFPIKWIEKSRGEYNFSLKSWSETTSQSEMQRTNYHVVKVSYKIPEKPFQITAWWLPVNEVEEMIDTNWLAAIMYEKGKRQMEQAAEHNSWNVHCSDKVWMKWSVRNLHNSTLALAYSEASFTRHIWQTYCEKLWGSQPSEVSFLEWD